MKAKIIIGTICSIFVVGCEEKQLGCGPDIFPARAIWKSCVPYTYDPIKNKCDTLEWNLFKIYKNQVGIIRKEKSIDIAFKIKVDTILLSPFLTLPECYQQEGMKVIFSGEARTYPISPEFNRDKPIIEITKIETAQ